MKQGAANGKRCPSCLSYVGPTATVCEACGTPVDGATAGAARGGSGGSGGSGWIAGFVLSAAVLALSAWLFLRSLPETRRGPGGPAETRAAASQPDARPGVGPAPPPSAPKRLAPFQAILGATDPDGRKVFVPALAVGATPHLLTGFDTILGCTEIGVVHPKGVEVLGLAGVATEHGFVLLEVRGGDALTPVPIQSVGSLTLPCEVDALPFTTEAAPGKAVASLVTVDAAGRRVLRVKSEVVASPFAALADGKCLALVLEGGEGLLLDHAIQYLRQPVRMSFAEFRRLHYETSGNFLYREGVRALKEDRLAEALEKLAAALVRSVALREKIAPFLARAYHLRIRELLRQGATAEAERLLSEAMAQMPGDLDLATARIDVALKTGDLTGALATLARLPAQARTSGLDEAVAESVKIRADELSERRRKQEAVDLMLAAVEVFPNRADLRLDLARLLLAVGRSDEAVQQADRARIQDPSLAGEADGVRASADRRRQPDILEIPFDPSAPSIETSIWLGTVQLDCIVDTGATKTAIPTSAAQRLGLLRAGLPTVDVETAGGTVKAQLVRIPEVRIGQFTLQNIEAVVLDLPGGLTGKGLIGLNVLKGFEVKVDRESGVVVLRKRRG